MKAKEIEIGRRYEARLVYRKTGEVEVIGKRDHGHYRIQVRLCEDVERASFSDRLASGTEKWIPSRDVVEEWGEEHEAARVEVRQREEANDERARRLEAIGLRRRPSFEEEMDRRREARIEARVRGEEFDEDAFDEEAGFDVRSFDGEVVIGAAEVDRWLALVEPRLDDRVGTVGAL